jgi:hypothetical protein
MAKFISYYLFYIVFDKFYVSTQADYFASEIIFLGLISKRGIGIIFIKVMLNIFKIYF